MQFIKLSILLALFILLFGCGGSNTTPLTNLSNEPPTQGGATPNSIVPSKSDYTFPEIDLTSGIPEHIVDTYWELDKPATLHFITLTDDQPQLPNAVTAYNQQLKSQRNMFRINEHGHVTIYAVFESTVRDISGKISTVSCLDIQPNIEQWHHLNNNRFEIFNNAQSLEADITLTEATLSIKQPNGVIKYKRADDFADDYLNHELCLSLATGAIGYNILKTNETTSLSDFEGVWRMHNKLEPIGVALTSTQLPNTKREYIRYDSDGFGEIWLFDEKRSCFYHSSKYTFSDLINSEFTRESIFPSDIAFLEKYRAFQPNIIVKEGIFGKSKQATPFLYLEFSHTPITRFPSFFEYTDIEIDESNTCDATEFLSEDLIPITQINDVQGVWSLSVDSSGEDLQYLHITQDGHLVRYDYRGDTFNNGIHCYQEIRRSKPIWVTENKYEEVTGAGFSNLLYFYQHKTGDLLIRSTNDQDYHYGQYLQKADTVEASGGISPICPKLRN